MQFVSVELEMSRVKILSNKVQLGLKFKQEVQGGDTDWETLREYVKPEKEPKEFWISERKSVAGETFGTTRL